jgi:trimeric autotransporter adhesin
VSSDAKLNEAIKDGKILYPRTSGAPLLNKLPYHYIQQEQQNQSINNSEISSAGANAFTLDESSLNNFNFNFNNLTDNDDSNASQSSTATAKTVASLSSSSLSSFNFISNSTSFNNIISSNNNNQTQQLTTTTTTTTTTTDTNREFNNFGDIFQSPSSNQAPPSPSSSISTTIAKSSPVSSPFSNLDYLNTEQINKQPTIAINNNNGSGGASAGAGSAIGSKSIGLNKKQSKSFSSASSISSATSSTSHKSNKSGSMSSSKKFLYFIEYKGPHQKTIKSTIGTNKFNLGGGAGGSVRSNKPSTKLSAKIASIKSHNQLHLNQIKNSQSSSSTNNINTTNAPQLGTSNSNEQFFEDSNDSTNLNSNFNDDEEELNAYEIRLEQQKVFLEFSNACNNNGDEANKRSCSTLNNEIENNNNGDFIKSDASTQEQNLLTSAILNTTNNNNNNNIEMTNSLEISSSVSNQQFNQPYGMISIIFLLEYF